MSQRQRILLNRGLALDNHLATSQLSANGSPQIGYRDRFLREARAASLKNDHIVTVYQVDEFNGVPFLAMELLQGESLEDALQAERQFSIFDTIQIARDVAKGLADETMRVKIQNTPAAPNQRKESVPAELSRLTIQFTSVETRS